MTSPERTRALIKSASKVLAETPERYRRERVYWALGEVLTPDQVSEIRALFLDTDGDRDMREGVRA